VGIRSDARLLEMAIRRRWNVPAELAERTVVELLQSEDERIRARALGIAVIMEGQNQKDEHKLIDVSNASLQLGDDSILRIAEETGLSAEAIRDANRKSIEAGS
jgi:hypothetical protein